MEVRYQANYSTGAHPFEAKRKANQLRKILKEEGFKRLFFKYPCSEVYSTEKVKAEIIVSGVKENYGCPEHGVRPHKYRNVGIKFDKSGGEFNETFIERIRDWYNGKQKC